MEQKISACYFPSTVVLIDDDRSYLTGLRAKLQVEKFFPRPFYNGTEALEFLKNHLPPLFTQRSVLRPAELQLDHRNIDVNVPAIRQEIYNPERFTQVAVIVVDYAMPDINGLELCKQLKNKPFKKIMLTGEADEKIAVEAFNQGVINKFIRKDAANFNEVINEAIYKLQQEYFYDLSRIIIDSLVDPESTNFTPLKDPAFVKMFKELCQKNNIAEYYLTDTYGSYLMLDFNGNPSWLAVKDEEGMQGAVHVAEGADIPFPKKILAEMRENKKILYLYESGGLSDNIEECSSSLHPAQKIEGINPIYYSYIKDPNAYNMTQKKILSYKDFLDKQ